MTGMKLSVGGVEIAYETHGSSGPWITFSHSLGCTRNMWSEQIAALSTRYRVLAYDLRGHGQSTADETVGSLALLADDVLALLDQLQIEKTHFVGISVGGMIGQTLALQSPERVLSLVLANTSPYMPPPVVDMWQQRIQTARDKGVACLALPSMERWFPQAFRDSQPETLARLVAEFSATSTLGYVACCQAIMGLDTRSQLGSIACPTTIIGGSEDPGSPMEVLKTMAQHIASSQLHVLEGAGHLSNIDRSAQFTAVLKSHLKTNV